MNGVRVVQLPNGANDAHMPPGEQDHAQLGKEDLIQLLQQAGQRIESLRRSERLQQSLYEIADLAGGSQDMQDMLRRIHVIVGALMYAENFYIVLYDEFRQKIRFLYFVDKLDPFINDPDAELDFDKADANLTVALLQGGEAMRGPSRELRAQRSIPPDPSNGPDSADWLGVPMLREDRVVGGIVVQSYEHPSVYSDEDRALLTYVAQHILTALDRHHARERLEQRVEERTRALKQANLDLQAEVVERQRSQELQRTLFRIAELSMISDSLEHFYAEIHKVVGGLLYARNFYIAMLSADATMLEFAYSVDERDIVRKPRKIASSLTEYVLSTGKPLLADRRRISQLESAGKVISHGALAHCWLGVPLLHEDKVVGVIAVQSYSPEFTFSIHDQELLTFVAFHIGSGLARKQAQDKLVLAHAGLEQRVSERTRELAEANAELVEQISERMRAERKLTHQAMHDVLTGLPNRAQLLEKLDLAIANARKHADACFAVLFLDLDRFKLVNDSVGHAVGDELLVESGRRIASSMRGDDMVTRLGGDEFAILAEGLDGPGMAEELAHRVLAALGAPIWIAGRELFPTASIGIAMWQPRYDTGEEMLRDADAAMYRAKSDGRDRSMLFDEAMRDEVLRALDLESDLRRAINNDAFEPYYQPIVKLGNAEQVGGEALLRWRHEKRGLLAPGEFIDVGEDSGLIEQVDWLMYARVIADMATHAMPGYVAINVSPRHFRSPDFAERLLGLLDVAGVDPSRLRIEITEVALLDDAPRISETLNLLRSQGVLAQLDDFGTGFSALSYLHRFPIAALKIDRSFVADLSGDARNESVAVIRAIVALAGSLGIEIIAEGVETMAQRECLRELGCIYAQGYLFGRPVPLED
ncbi:EAL domain-containing protein [Thermomonas sp.]|uniref:bifunctional diguanylate cyclase/phosphodiesterase n=1 Tax=Thermomonas sp. TaxID=1971895 RepID=UPI00248A36D4|nr:EAL domain-containing protein [Thermomonas sp.]MDI1253753.1 EAL domain-containing protein [Thermomonas sp.]